MTNSFYSNKSPIISLFVLMMLVAVASGTSQVIMIMIGQGMGMELDVIVTSLDPEKPDSANQYFIMLMQMIISMVSFILVPALFYVFYLKSSLTDSLELPDFNIKPFIILFGVTVSFMIVNAVFIEWNREIEFPEPFQSSAKSLEDQAELLTRYLTNFQTIPYFLLGFIVIAIIPAIGEEFLFRGLIQNLTKSIFGNIHVAIWVTASLFSAFHFQFFGFVPRMLLGAFFGYVLYFSGNLWYAIAAHFINNGFTLLMLYLYQKEIIRYDIENTESIPLETVAIFFIIGVVLFWSFIKYFQNSITHANE